MPIASSEFIDYYIRLILIKKIFQGNEGIDEQVTKSSKRGLNSPKERMKIERESISPMNSWSKHTKEN